MAKAKTSPKRAFSFTNIPARKLQPGVRVASHQPQTSLANRTLAIRALTEALTDGDTDAFKEILAGHLAAIHKESFHAEAGVSRRTLYRMLAPEGNPTLENIARVVRAIAK